MKLSDEELKRLLREETRRVPQGECPDPDLFRRARESALTDDERKRLADHLAGCSDCAEEYRMLGDLTAQLRIFEQASQQGFVLGERTDHLGTAQEIAKGDRIVGFGECFPRWGYRW